MIKTLRSFWHFIAAVWTRVGDGHFGLIAAGVAFYGIFAVFPGLAAVVAIWGMVSDPLVIAGYLAIAGRLLLISTGIVEQLYVPHGICG